MLLAADQALVQRLALPLHRRHHGLQLADQFGHALGLLPQQLERLLALMALMGLRVGAQGGRDLRVEHLPGLQSLAPAQRRGKTQHRGRGHARQRRTERQPQALHRRGQRGADGLQVRRTVQRHAGAVQRDYHAEEGAQHAQQHQEAGQVRRQRRARQADALAFDAQAHRIAQGRGQLLEPGAEARGGRGQVRHGACQGGGGLVEAMQFQPTHQVEPADEHRDGQRQRVRADVAGTDPAHGDQANDKNCVVKKSIHGTLVALCEGLRAVLRPVEIESPVRRAARAGCLCGTRPATLRAGLRCRVRLALSGRPAASA